VEIMVCILCWKLGLRWSLPIVRLTLVETQFEVESSDSETKGRQFTLALGYLMGDMEENDIVGPKACDHGDLVGYVSILDEKVQDLERIFREAIENKGDQTWKLMRLLEVVG
ncbi:hypothetical protein L195_g059492, partial [Trifolium pratense]